LNRVVEETNQLGFTRYFVYDAVGKLTGRTDRNGRAIEYTYDNLYRRTQENWLDEYESSVRTIDWTYDAAGQLTAASDPAADYTYTYDALGRATTLTHDIVGLGSQVIMNHTFDALGNRTQLAATIGSTADFVTEYTYDALRRMTSIQQHGVSGGNAVAEKRIDLTYDAASQWQTITRYADLAATKLVATSAYAFDAAGRMTSLDHSQGSTSLAGYSWQYDAGNRVTQFVSLLDGAVNYNYDKTNQLTGADYSAGAGLPTAPPDESYAYDANGNRTITGYVTGPNNQLLSDGTYDYEYDKEGNRILRTNIATGETIQYEWDHRNRLIKITDKDATSEITQVAEYTYDFQNRRIAKSLSTLHSPLSTTYYLYDGNRWERGHAGDHIALQFDGAGTLTNRYLYGPAVDQILADEQIDQVLGPTAAGKVLWPLADNLGTVRDLADFDDVTDVTSIANHRQYDSFGEIIADSNSAIDHIFVFTGRQRDEESGFHYYRARYFDSKIGRFVGEDPISFQAGDANLQRYVGNGATNLVDPSGEQVGISKHWHDVSGGGFVGGAEINDGISGLGIGRQSTDGTEHYECVPRCRNHVMVGGMMLDRRPWLNSRDQRRALSFAWSDTGYSEIQRILGIALNGPQYGGFIQSMRRLPSPEMHRTMGGVGPCINWAYDVYKNNNFENKTLDPKNRNPGPFRTVYVEKVTFKIHGSGTFWTNHVVLRVEVYASQVGVGRADVFYLDNGWLGGDDHIFFPSDIPSHYFDEQPQMMRNGLTSPGYRAEPHVSEYSLPSDFTTFPP
jgi:RHS repeat-associated protein